MTDHPDIVLASGSPRRRELLAQVGIRCTVIPSVVDESLRPGETPAQHVLRLALEKAQEVARRPDSPGRWFIGSDTIVLRDDCILGKPADAAEAASMLRSLSGRSHQVLSAFAVYDRESARSHCEVVTTKVWFKPLTGREIAGYIAGGEPFDKAGSYAIQGLGAFMVTAIEGSYTNVVGLPLAQVVAALEGLGALSLFP